MDYLVPVGAMLSVAKVEAVRRGDVKAVAPALLYACQLTACRRLCITEGYPPPTVEADQLHRTQQYLVDVDSALDLDVTSSLQV